MDYEGYLPIIYHTLAPQGKRQRPPKRGGQNSQYTEYQYQLTWTKSDGNTIFQAQVSTDPKMVNFRRKTIQGDSYCSSRFRGDYRYQENKHNETVDPEQTMQDHRVSLAQRSNSMHGFPIVRSPDSSVQTRPRHVQYMPETTLPKPAYVSFHFARQGTVLTPPTHMPILRYSTQGNRSQQPNESPAWRIG